jgi:DNA-binding transcriptional LysR family regulator
LSGGLSAAERRGALRGQLADGEIDVVIGNWPQPPEGLHMAKLFEDEVVCLVSPKHPAVRRGWDVQQWLQAEHCANPGLSRCPGRDRRTVGRHGFEPPGGGTLRAFQSDSRHGGIKLACHDLGQIVL